MPRMMRTRTEYRKLREVSRDHFVPVGSQMGYPANGVYKQVTLPNGKRATVSVVGRTGYLPAESYEELCG